MISEMREQDKSNTTSLIYIDQFMDQYQFPSQIDRIQFKVLTTLPLQFKGF